MDMHLRTNIARYHMYPYVSICIHVPICVYTIVYLLHYLLKYLSTESTIIHAGLGEGLGKGHPAAHGYSFGSLRRRGVAPVCRCKKVSGNYKSTNDNWVMNRCIWYTHTHTLHIYIYTYYHYINYVYIYNIIIYNYIYIYVPLLKMLKGSDNPTISRKIIIISHNSTHRLN